MCGEGVGGVCGGVGGGRGVGSGRDGKLINLSNWTDKKPE